MRLAVLIPTFNRPHDLRACVESVLPVLVEGAGVLVVDDVSDDEEHLAYLQALADAEAPVEVVSLRKKHGCTRARMAVLDTITAEFVVILDDDAYLIDPDSDVLTEVVRRFEREPRLGAQAFSIEEPLGRRPLGEKPFDGQRGWGDGHLTSKFINCGCAFRMAAYRDAGGYRSDFDSPYGEENDLAVRLLDRGWLIRQFETPLVFHSKSLTARSTWESERGRMLNYLRFAWWYHPLWFALPYTVWLLQKRVRQGIGDRELREGVLKGLRDFVGEFGATLRRRRVSTEALKRFYGLHAGVHCDGHTGALDELSRKSLVRVLYEYAFE